jgi:hypothetical protein
MNQNVDTNTFQKQLGEKKGKKEENLKQYSKIFQFSAMESSK